jgi:uncharacterized membrane protein
VDPRYLLFTGAMAVASALCLRDAWGDRERLALYAGSLGYGFVLEKLVIVAFERYSYPAASYLFDALGVPFAIALGWSAVVYAAVATARALSLSGAGMAGFAALYALHVDLSMDAVAIRVPYWTWSPPGPWFGVPLGNFFGWFCVAFLFVGWTEALRRVRPGIDPFVRAGGAALAALATLLVALQGWISLLGSAASEAVALVLLGGGALALVIRGRPRSRGGSLTALAATLVFHAFFLAVLLAGGYYREAPALLALAVGMALVGLGVHAVAERGAGVSGPGDERGEPG